MASLTAIVLSSTDKGVRVARQPDGAEGWIAKSGISNLAKLDLASKAAQLIEIPKDKEWMLKKFAAPGSPEAHANAEAKKEAAKPPEERMQPPFTTQDVADAAGIDIEEVLNACAAKIEELHGLVKPDAALVLVAKDLGLDPAALAPKAPAALVSQGGADNGATLHLASACVHDAPDAPAAPLFVLFTTSRADMDVEAAAGYNRVVLCTSIEVTSPGRFLPALLVCRVDGGAPYVAPWDRVLLARGVA